jgi:hypothetical protein
MLKIGMRMQPANKEKILMEIRRKYASEFIGTRSSHEEGAKSKCQWRTSMAFNYLQTVLNVQRRETCSVNEVPQKQQNKSSNSVLGLGNENVGLYESSLLIAFNLQKQ